MCKLIRHLKKAIKATDVEDDGNSDQSRSSSSRWQAVPAEVQAKGSKKHFPQGIKLFYKPETPGSCNMDVVFIHGLNGDREETWKAKHAEQPWIKTLLPKELPNARILSFGYDAHVVNATGMVSVNSIGNHSSNLLSALANYREKDDTNGRPIIFVCHSLGGLVCEDALFASRQKPEQHLKSVLQCTHGILLLGTPHRGSGLARCAEILAKSMGFLKQTNPKILEVLERDSEVLARVQEEFHTMIRGMNETGEQRIKITCFSEELPLKGLGIVVAKESAILPGYTPISIRANHMDMTKFFDEEDPGFIAVVGELRRWSKETATSLAVGEGLRKAEAQNAKYIIPYTSNPDFIRRHAIFEQLKTQLDFKGQQAQTFQARVALYGLGGSGKTQIAIDYVYWSKKEFAQQSIFWIHASNHDRFTQAFTGIANELKIPGRDDPSADILLLVKSWLARSENGSWLMVLDNADDAEIFFDSHSTKARKPDSAQPPISGSLGQYVPDCSHGSLLVTTRDKATGTKFTTNRSRSMVKVAEMNSAESSRLICAKIGSVDSTQENKNVDLLAERLNHIPLALAQAAAYIEEKSMDISVYLETLDESDDSMIELLSKPWVAEGRDSSVPHAVAATWIVSFTQIQETNPDASKVLSTICWFDRQGIQKALLQSCFLEEEDLMNGHSSLDQDETKFPSTSTLLDAIGVLKAFSFVTEGPDKSFTIHRLIQLVTRKWLQQEKQSDLWLGHAILVLAYNFPYKDLENEDRKTSLELLPHSFSVLNIDEVGVSSDIVLSRCYLQHKVANTLYYQGRYKEAERIASEVVKVQEEILGCDHNHTLNSKNILAFTQHDQGKYKEAEALYTAVLQVEERVYGLENLSTLISMYNLGKLYEEQGRYKEAQELQLKVLEVRKTKLGPEDPDTLYAMLAVASLYGVQGRFKDAEELQAEVLEICKRTLDPEHPHTLTCMNNLAITYEMQSQYQDAEKLQLEVLEIRKKSFGLEHPETLKAMGNLAGTYSNQSKNEDAEKIQTEVLKARKRLFGIDSLATLLAMSHLANTYRSQERYQEAKELGLEAWEGLQRFLGKDHPDTLIAMCNLALTYFKQGRYQEAKRLGSEGLEGRQRVLGKDHPDTLLAMNNLAHTFKSLGNNQEALELMRECVRLRIERYGEDFFDEWNSQENLRIWEEEALELGDGEDRETH